MPDASDVKSDRLKRRSVATPKTAHLLLTLAVIMRAAIVRNDTSAQDVGDKTGNELEALFRWSFLTQSAGSAELLLKLCDQSVLSARPVLKSRGFHRALDPTAKSPDAAISPQCQVSRIVAKDAGAEPQDREGRRQRETGRRRVMRLRNPTLQRQRRSKYQMGHRISVIRLDRPI
jgi:hypothetical protein